MNTKPSRNPFSNIINIKCHQHCKKIINIRHRQTQILKEHTHTQIHLFIAISKY